MKANSRENAAYIVLEGDLDLSRKDDIVSALPDPASVSSIVINLSRATYIDSLVMGALVQFRREFIRSGGNPADLAIMLRSDSAVRRAFELTGLTRLFAIAYVELPAGRPEERIATTAPDSKATI